MNIADTLSPDLSVTVGVTGLQEGGCLGVGQCAGRGLEILQEKPAGKQQQQQQQVQSTYPCLQRRRAYTQSVSLELSLLDEPALVLVDDVEGLVQLLRGLPGQPTGGKELLMVECAIGYNHSERINTYHNNINNKSILVIIIIRVTFARFQGCSDVSIFQGTRERHFDLLHNNKEFV